MEKLKVHWATPVKEGAAGNAYGYATHNRMMREYCSKYFEYIEDADIAITITPADFFRHVEGKFNILFTMFEFMDLPNVYLHRMSRADAIVVPCRFCKDLFKRHTDLPVDVCHEGVDPEVYQFHQRRVPNMPAEKFRFLWVGAPNPRKGYPFILKLIEAMEELPHIEFYMKTTFSPVTRKEYLTKLWRNRKKIRKEQGHDYFNALRAHNKQSHMHNQKNIMGKHNNVIMDTRRLSLEELLDVYKSSHSFLLPTLGEGWGLTLTEAMATGLPCVATAVTGCAEYFDSSVGYPIKYTMREERLLNYDLKTRGYFPDVNDLIAQMKGLFQNYPKALAKGKKASERIRNKFTWELAAKRFYEIVKKHADNRSAVNV